ncbi:MAG: PAS domain S-box protein [Bacteroidota bacterium]
MKARQYLPRRGSFASYLMAFVLLAVALYVRLAMAPVNAGLQYVTFFPAVTLAVVLGGFGPGMAVTLGGTALASFIFTAPYYQVSLLNLQTSLWPNIVFMLDGLVVCTAIEAMYRYQGKYIVEMEEVRQNSARLTSLNRALQDSEAFNLSIFDSRSEHVVVLDERGWIIAVNASWRRFAMDNGGEQYADCIGGDYLAVCQAAAGAPDAPEVPAVIAGIQAVMAGEISDFELEYPCHSPSEERWFSMHVTPLQGSRRGVVVAHENISRRKAMEKVLLHHAAIVESSEDAIIGKTLDGIVTSWNQGAEQIFGYACDEAIGQHVSLIVPEHCREEEKRILDGIAKGVALKHYQTVRQKKGGELIDISVTISPLRDGAGAIVGASTVARDITAQKRLEQELRIAAIAFEAQEGMVVTDARETILRVNHAFAANSGYAAEELVGRNIRLLQSGRHPPAFYAEMWQIIQRDGAWQGEIWNRRKNGDVYPEWLTITAVKDAAGNTSHYVGTHTDITSRKAAEDEIKHLAFYDPLTRLPNRRLLMDRLGQCLSTSGRLDRSAALMFIDMDNFKFLNDSLGHEKGDLLLQQVARRLLACVREGDTVARLGGDEFVVVLELLSGDALEAMSQAESIACKILAALNERYQLAEHEFHSTPSIGIALFDGRDCSADDLLKEADRAMYQAKNGGRNAIRFADRPVAPAPLPPLYHG